MTGDGLKTFNAKNLVPVTVWRNFAPSLRVSRTMQEKVVELKKYRRMKMLQTNLQEVESAAELQKMLEENENVMVCCGRMGPMCIPVYEVMEEIEEDYSHVKFAVMAFDSPEAGVIRNAPECRGFMGLPFTMYYKNGKVVNATSSIQNFKQVTNILDDSFGKN